MVEFELVKKGHTIRFNTRGVSLGEATLIWGRLNPMDIHSLVADTGQNLCVWGDGLSVFIQRGRGDNISIDCGKEIKND